ncbi:uncharacterized protein [Trachinotus anak]|uniref:uncharacterized protein n=1 Tax=Trachinotus anak TaxID=443729 RepID=UPI0039F18B8A
MAFVLDEFVANPTWSQLDHCRKADLLAIADFYGIPVSTSLRKSDLKTVLLNGLTSKGILILPSDVETLGTGVEGMDTILSGAGHSDSPVAEATECVVTPNVQETGSGKKPVTLPRFDPDSAESSPGSRLGARMKLRIARLNMEKEKEEREFQLRRELELKRLEAETVIRMCELALQKGTTKTGSPVSAQSVPDSATTFDVSRHISLVPVFRESEVESYFSAFERIANALHWPKDVWAILLQCKLSGKAQEACSSLSLEDSLVYDKVKSAILRVYELVPEAYRQRFRSLRKTSGQTFTDFAREKELLFDRWCSACKADDLASVRELMLLEEFKGCVPERTVVYLNEQKVTTLQQAASLADEFALTHKAVFTKRDSTTSDSSQQGMSLVPPHPCLV